MTFNGDAQNILSFKGDGAIDEIPLNYKKAI